MRKAQAWSIDLIIAVVIFILVMTIFYTLLVREPKTDVRALQKEAQIISEKLQSSQSGGDCAFINGKDIDITKMRRCYNEKSPEEFARETNIENKFCIYLIDQNGRVVSIDNRTGWGYGDLNISNTSCGTMYEEPIPP